MSENGVRPPGSRGISVTSMSCASNGGAFLGAIRKRSPCSGEKSAAVRVSRSRMTGESVAHDALLAAPERRVELLQSLQLASRAVRREIVVEVAALGSRCVTSIGGIPVMCRLLSVSPCQAQRFCESRPSDAQHDERDVVAWLRASSVQRRTLDAVRDL